MKKEFSRSNEAIEKYVENVFHPEDDILKDIRVRAAKAGLPDIHVGTMDGLHLELIVRAAGARKIVEIGTLAGYSGVCLARGMPKDGKLYTFEYEAKHAEVAAESFRKARLSSQVEIVVGHAVEKLREYEKYGPFDLVFIDADKPSYPAYLAWSIANLRKGGAILADNTFAGGEICDETMQSERLEALRKYNQTIATDTRLRSTILPTSDGLSFSIKL